MRTALRIVLAAIPGLLALLVLTVPVLAASCVLTDTGDVVLNTACTLDGTMVADGTYVSGQTVGDIIVSGADVTIQPDTTITWRPGESIRLENGGRLFMGANSSLKQTELQPYLLQKLGFDVYAAGAPVRLYSQNLFVCSGATCTITAPGGYGHLLVEGQVKIAGGSPGAGKVLTSDAAGLATWQTPSSGSYVPSGMIAAFDAACPAGWTEYTNARGRYVVGMPSGGTLAGTAGTALTNLENRSVGQHNHTISDPGHQHGPGTFNAHGSWNVSGGGPGFITTVAGSGNADPISGISSVAYTGATIANTGTVAGTNAPYIQLVWCKKN